MSRSSRTGTVPQLTLLGNRRRPFGHRFWILLPGLLMILFDLGVTLYFQPPEYWQASYDLTTERSPIGMLLMRFHPVAFFAFMAGYIAVCAGLVLWLPSPWHRIVALALVVGHTAGVHSWLGHRVYWVMIVVFLLISAVTVFSWQKAGRRDSG